MCVTVNEDFVHLLEDFILGTELVAYVCHCFVGVV